MLQYQILLILHLVFSILRIILVNFIGHCIVEIIAGVVQLAAVVFGQIVLGSWLVLSAFGYFLL